VKSEVVLDIIKTSSVILLIMLVIFIISIQIFSGVTRSIRSLVASMDTFKIDFHHRAEVTSADEIGLLASNFNEMAENIGLQVEMLQTQAVILEEQTADIAEQNELLEERVKERTEELSSAKEELQLFNEELKKQVDDEVRKRMEVEVDRQKERETLIRSEKMAQLGNMLGAIIHQWKQPLNAIALETQGIQMSNIYGELDNAEVERVVKSIMNSISFMSMTADSFRDFYKTSKEKKEFPIIEQVDSVVEILRKQLQVSNIALTIEGDKTISASGFTSEFKQVVLNIINNAKDVFEEMKISGANLQIKISKEGDKAILTITDNAGGIPEKLLPDKLFEAFESTKGDKGTGIGLSISRTIIEENMQGRLTAKNTEDGACFRVELPLA
jgi:C4-dicarboxylate-specific signal transduction histidine kinase